MNKFGTIFLMVFSLLITSCKKNNSYVIEYSTAGCFGKCPILDMKLINDSLYVNFIKHNQKKGLFFFKIRQDQLGSINTLIEQILVNEIEDDYWSGIEDVSSTVFYLKSKNRTVETFYDDHIAPTEIDTLYKYLLSISKEDLKEIKNSTITFSTREKIPIDTLPLPPPPPMSEWEKKLYENDSITE